MRTVIALGANLGDPSKQISHAVDALRDIMIVSALSALYETEPFDVPDDQPMYTNAVVIGECALEPRDLMKELLAIESQLGRQRTFAKAARTIDLDLIDYGGYSMESADLTLPHPRAHLRKFVLEPWFEIEPDGVLPGKGPIRELLAALNGAA